MDRYRIPEIENSFVQVAMDLKEILVLDGMDLRPDPPGFRIRYNDLYGPLPNILVDDTGDRLAVLDKIQNEAAKLTAIVRIRQDLAGMFRGCKILLPTRTDEGYVVGLKFHGKTALAEEKSHWEEYHELVREAVGNLF
jgi:hypothetical protein